MVYGSVSAEVQVNAAASAAWGVYGTLKLAEYTEQALPDVIDRIEVQGDGSPATVLEIFFLPGKLPFSSHFMFCNNYLKHVINFSNLYTYDNISNVTLYLT